jgi:hypothetical protein
MNLQQCRNIINFDLPWNPMRLVQRHGRVDRIGSKHAQVFLRTFFPDKQLNRLLDLENRVKRKLAQAARSVGLEAAPIEEGASGEQSFSETREEIDRLLAENRTIFEQGGTASAAQSGEEYRQELRRALERFGDEIERLPWKAGSGMVKGRVRGHFFFAKVAHRYYTRFVPAGQPREIVHELGTCLRLIECQEETPLVMLLDLKQTAYSAWETARGDIYSAWTRETDPRNLQPRVSRLNREVAEFMRSHPPYDVEQRRLERCLDAIESPWSHTEMRTLRQVFRQEYESREARSRAVVAEVERLGIEPFQSQQPLPPIQQDDVRLICWMAIESSGT